MGWKEEWNFATENRSESTYTDFGDAPSSDPVSENDEDEVSFEEVLKMDEESMKLLSQEDM